MRICDLIQVENASHVDAKRAGLDLFYKGLEWCSHEIFRTAGIDGEADCIWNDIHWAEVIEPTYFRPCRSCKRCRAGVHLKRIGEAGRAHELKSLVSAALGRTDRQRAPGRPL